MTTPTGRPRGRPKTKEYVTLMARVPQELAARVQRYASVHQQSLSVVLRDGLALLLEEDRYRPFLSDRNTEGENVSDKKAERPDILSDRKAESMTHPSEDTRAVPLFLSDTKEEDGTPQTEQSSSAPAYRLAKVCLAGHPYDGVCCSRCEEVRRKKQPSKGRYSTTHKVRRR